MPRKSILALFSLCLAALFTHACASEPEDPAERVSETRSGYSAKLNGFVVHQVPQPEEEAPVEEAEGPVEPGAEGEGEGDEETAEEVPLRQDVILDILVSRDSRESLPGLTVDVTQADAQENEKARWKVYLDVSDVMRGPGTQISYRLEDVEVEEEDYFHVEVRHPVPPGERGEYREFQEHTEGRQ